MTPAEEKINALWLKERLASIERGFDRLEHHFDVEVKTRVNSMEGRLREVEKISFAQDAKLKMWVTVFSLIASAVSSGVVGMIVWALTKVKAAP